MWSKLVGGGDLSLKCLDKYCIIWAHKWCQDVTCFLRNKWQIKESMPPPTTHTHTSGVNIPHGQTQRQIWRSIKGSGHTLGSIGSHLSAPRRLIFLRPSLCWVLTGPHFYFINVTADEAFASGIMASVSSSVFLLSPPGCYCWKSILNAMTTQQQATQGLFLSPGDGKPPQVQYDTFKLVLVLPIMKETKHSRAYLSWHTSRKFLEAYRMKDWKY